MAGESGAGNGALTFDEMIQEGILVGVPVQDIDDWTWGEVLALIRADRERQRRAGKVMAVIAAGGAQYVAAYLRGSQVPELAEVFPFWTDEEQKTMKISKYRQMMERLVGGGAQNV